MSIKGQGHSFTLVKVHSDFKVKCLTFGLYTQVSDSGPLGPLVLNVQIRYASATNDFHRIVYTLVRTGLFGKDLSQLCFKLNLNKQINKWS